MAKNRLFTSESVTEGHPDKICDQISDAILDAILAQDPNGRVACECTVTTGVVNVMGEITTDCYVDIPKVVRQTVREIGYDRAKYGFDCETCAVITNIGDAHIEFLGSREGILKAKSEIFENLDADGVAIQKTPTVLEELVDTVLVRFQKLHPGVPVEVKLPDDFIVIPMDSMLIQQVLTNLLENAVLHAEGMTHLTLRVFTLGRRAVFEVIDNGCGIPKEQLKRLFSGTTLAQDTSSSGRHGMGIGLSVCAAIIKAHGGEIKAESAPGEGTTIRFWLETEEVDTEETEDEQ